ncbi:MAG: inosine/xanthosine triphosphatase [Pseudomonadota bacterium]
MKVVVSSANPVKLAATRRAFEATFPAVEITIESCAVDSGVADQPMHDEETRRGALNRARAARAAVPGADFWVGLEGGLERIDDTLMASAWMAVLGQEERPGLSRTVGLPIPPAVQSLVDEGMELGDANDRVFSTLNSKQGGGAFGLLTEGRITRESVYADTLMVALMPFSNPLFPQS